MSNYRKLSLDTSGNNLRCPQCLIRFTNPKLLACAHTFCLECLESLVQKLEEGEDQSKISCPTCSEVTKLESNEVGSLHPNYILQNLINSIDGKSSRIPNCGECELASSSEFCYDCKMPMCECCAQHHLKVKRFSIHRMDDLESVKPELISSSSRYCTTHSELLKYFCKECSLVVCHDCLISKAHVNHERCLIAEILEETKAELVTLIAKGEEESTKSIQFFENVDNALVKTEKEKDKSTEVIEKTFNTVIETLKEQKQKLLNKVMDPYTKSKKVVDQAKLKRQVLSDMLQYANKLLTSEEKNNFEALSGVINLLTDSLNQCEIKEGEKRKVNFVASTHLSHAYPSRTRNQVYPKLQSTITPPSTSTMSPLPPVFDPFQPILIPPSTLTSPSPPVFHQPQPTITEPQPDAHGHPRYRSTDGKYYCKSPDGEYFLVYRSGDYYDELDSTRYYEFAHKKLICNSKVGCIDINVESVHAEVKEIAHNQFVNSCKDFSNKSLFNFLG